MPPLSSNWQQKVRSGDILPLVEMATIADLRHKHLEVFAKLDKGPVVIAQRSKPTAVLVSIPQWNDIARRLKQLELLTEARRISDEMTTDPNKSISHDELRQQLATKAFHARVSKTECPEI